MRHFQGECVGSLWVLVTRTMQCDGSLPTHGMGVSLALAHATHAHTEKGNTLLC